MVGRCPGTPTCSSRTIAEARPGSLLVRDREAPVRDRATQREVLARLAGVSAAHLAEAPGLSRPYCAAILRGERVPYTRWWGALRGVGADSAKA